MNSNEKKLPLVGAVFGGFVSSLTLGLSPWLAHYVFEFSLFHQLFWTGLYVVLLACLVGFRRVLFRKIPVPVLFVIVPLPFVIWLSSFSHLRSVEGWIGYLLLAAVYAASGGFLYGLYQWFKRYSVSRSVLIVLVILVVTGSYKAATSRLLPSEWILGHCEPIELQDDPGWGLDVMYPLSRRLRTLGPWLLTEEFSGSRSVVVLVVDALRYDAVGDSLFGQPVAPNLRDFSRNEIRFRNYRVQAGWTKPSVASFFTGQYVRDHGTYFGGEFTVGRDGEYSTSSRSHVLPESFDTLAERMKQRNYRTLGFMINPLSGRTFGFGQGFDAYLDPLQGYHSDDYAFDQFLFWTWKHRDEKNFIYLHTSGAHWHYPHALDNEEFMGETYFFQNGDLVYEPKYDLRNESILAAYRRGKFELPLRDQYFFRTLYASQLNYYDREFFKPLVSYMERFGMLDKSLFAVTADHGEELFERGNFGHGENLYDETIHVPLLLSLPEGHPIDRTTIEADVESLDLTASLLDFTGSNSQGVNGETLLPLISGSAKSHGSTVSLAEYSDHGFHSGSYRKYIQRASVTDYPWKLILDYETQTTELRSVDNASGQTDETNRERIENRLLNRLRTSLGSDSGLRRAPVSLERVTSEQQKTLMNLGYLE